MGTQRPERQAQDQGRKTSEKHGSHPRTLGGRLNVGHEILGQGSRAPVIGSSVGGVGTKVGGGAVKVYKPAYTHSIMGGWDDYE